jgi:hypothetical protein
MKGILFMMDYAGANMEKDLACPFVSSARGK